MTTTTNTTPNNAPSPLAPATGAQAGGDASGPDALRADDPRLALAKAAAITGSLISSVRPDQLDHPTPCAEFDVRRLLGHLVAVLDRIATAGRDGDLDAVPVLRSGVADDGWRAAWDAAAHDVQAAWSDPAELAKMKVLSFATLPAPVALAIYTSEVVTHGWDLAKATGQEPVWDDDVVGASLRTMRMALPAEGRGDEIPFGPVVEVPADAPLIDQLVGWVGRRP